MINFFKNRLIEVGIALRIVVGVIGCAAGLAVLWTVNIAGLPVDWLREWAAERSWTKPLNWLLAPITWAFDALTFAGKCMVNAACWVMK